MLNPLCIIWNSFEYTAFVTVPPGNARAISKRHGLVDGHKNMPEQTLSRFLFWRQQKLWFVILPAVASLVLALVHTGQLRGLPYRNLAADQLHVFVRRHTLPVWEISLRRKNLAARRSVSCSTIWGALCARDSCAGSPATRSSSGS